MPGPLHCSGRFVAGVSSLHGATARHEPATAVTSPFCAKADRAKRGDAKAHPPARAAGAGSGRGQRSAEERPAEAEGPAGHRQSMRAIRRRLRSGPGYADLRPDERLCADRLHHIGAGALAPSPRNKLSKRLLLVRLALSSRGVGGIVSKESLSSSTTFNCVAPRDPPSP